jgi:hypothetical protein
VNGNIHNIECQAVDQITGTFPTFRLDDIITEARATIGAHHVFPQEIGGAAVKLLIGIRSTQLAPVLRFRLPSGLCVYESKFRDVYGATLCFGGPHEVFTRGYKQAGFRVTTGMLQVLFAESCLGLHNNNNNNNNNNNLFFHQSSRYIKVWLKLHEYIF